MQWTSAALQEMARLAIAPLPMLPTLVLLGGVETVVSSATIRRQVARMARGELAEFPGRAARDLHGAAGDRRRGLGDGSTASSTASPASGGRLRGGRSAADGKREGGWCKGLELRR